MAIPLKYNLRNLVARKASTGMTTFVIGLVVAVFLCVLALVQGVTRTLSVTASTRNVIAMRVGSQAEMQSVITRDQADQMQAMPGPERDASGKALVSPELITLINVPREDGKTNSNVQVRGMDPIGMTIRPSVKIVDGRMFNAGTNEAIVSKNLSKRFASMNVGETLKTGSYRWVIVGLFDAQGSAYESEIWTDARGLQQQTKRNMFSSVFIRLADSEAANRYIETIKGDQRLKLEGKTERKYYDEQMITGAPIKALAFIVGFFTAIGASFGAMNTMYAQVSARTREIGTLRALGFSRRSILVSFVIESLMLCLAGGLLGVVFTFLVFNLFLTHPTGTMNFRTFSEVLFNFRMTPELIAGGLVFALAMGIIGGFFPAARAARLKITTALREV
ncbi:MAG TPA: FtsX-like permease family protein [Thermoanaerobaculia bacterium]|jgi:ABC-type antimicrobial peptide transport system permease subunit|nr:FtsX-like permease family protein [Thermoanaerobaculia bacterium]